MKRYIYLISPQKIRGSKFYNELHKVLKTKKVKYFQLRLKNISNKNLLLISRKTKKIVKKYGTKFLINDNLSIADISIAAQLSLLKFPRSSGPFLEGKGCPEFMNNPYLDNLFIWRDNIEEYLFSANNQQM